MSNALFPLVARDINAPLAFLTELKDEKGSSSVIDVGTFLAHVQHLAEQLPDGQYAINLCENRYSFLVAFCAVILRGSTNLLPPNKNVLTQEQLAKEYSKSYIIYDGCTISESIQAFSVCNIDFQTASRLTEIPQVSDDHVACIAFTSGSTGSSKPNIKYWQTLRCSTDINFRHMLPATTQTLFQLATVPAQHMWGLETSVLMPLFKNICMSDAKPLFPKDILDTLSRLPTPRLLVSTPVHLRALVGSDDTVALDAVLCATSPLNKTLASKVEAQFNTQLFEVYGCSEVGSMAVRQTARESTWQPFAGIRFETSGAQTTASAEHLPEDTILQDTIELADDGRFRLSGRSSDLVKIAGKRASLFEINQILLDFSGLIDGIVVHPESAHELTRLCAIVVLKPQIEKRDLVVYLRKHLDSAFVPRPIYIVDSLPRESSGKLAKKNVNMLLASLKKKTDK